VPDEPTLEPRIEAERTTRVLNPALQYPGNGTQAWAIAGTHRLRSRRGLRDLRS
jgi:hypothetical protein